MTEQAAAERAAAQPGAVDPRDPVAAPVEATPTPVGDDGLLYALFLQQYGRLVRLAVAIGGSPQYAEDAVQEAFARLFARPRRLRDRERAEAYLRSAVLNAARSAHRRHDREQPAAPTAAPAANTRSSSDATTQLDNRDAVVGAMRALPKREREAVALRYLLDLSEQETARELRISVGSVKAYTSRGLDRLAELLGNHDD